MVEQPSEKFKTTATRPHANPVIPQE